MVGGEEENTPAEVQFPAAVPVLLPGGAAALVQDGHKDLQHLWVGLVQLVKEEHRVGVPADGLQHRGVLVAHVPRRRAGEAVDRVGLCKGIQLGPHQLITRITQPGVQGGGNLLGQLGLAHAGGAVEDEGEGPQGLGFADVPVELEGGGLHRVALPQDLGLEGPVQPGKALRHGGRGAQGGGVPVQRLKALPQVVEGIKAAAVPLGPKFRQPGVGALIGHGGAEVEQVGFSLPPKPHPDLRGHASGGEGAGGKLIAVSLLGTGVNPVLQLGVAGGAAGAELGKVHPYNLLTAAEHVPSEEG